MDAGTCVSPWPWFSSWPFIRGLFLDRGPKSQWSTIRLLTRTVTSPASASSGSCVAGPYQDRRQPRCATRLTFEKCKCARLARRPCRFRDWPEFLRFPEVGRPWVPLRSPRTQPALEGRITARYRDARRPSQSTPRIQPGNTVYVGGAY